MRDLKESKAQHAAAKVDAEVQAIPILDNQQTSTGDMLSTKY